MRHSRYRRHRRYIRHERHNPAVVIAPLTASIPATSTAATGGTMTIVSTKTGGVAPYTYEWRRNGTLLSGQNGENLILAAVASADAGIYQVVIRDGSGQSANSNTCTVTIT